MRLNVLIPIPFFNNDDTTLGGRKFLKKKPPQLQKNPAQIQLTTSKGIFLKN